MIAVLSTSSPRTSCAFFEGDKLVSSAQTDVLSASTSLLSLIQTLKVAPERVNMWVADIGPGSFTGVRVAVTMAKTLAYAFSVPCAGIAAPMLMSDGKVAIPSRKHEWLLFEPGSEPTLVRELPSDAAAYGTGIERPVYPLAERAGRALGRLVSVDASELVPAYFLEPSISTPKKAFGVQR